MTAPRSSHSETSKRPRLTAEDHRLRAITEAQWQDTYLALLRAFGWGYYVAPKAGVRALGTVRGVRPGWPDVTAWRGPRLLFAELKRETGKTRPEQDATLAALAATGAEVYVHRPSDLAEVRAVLGRPVGGAW
jgi:hypothetical protein